MSNKPYPDRLTLLRLETEALLRASLSHVVCTVVSLQPDDHAEQVDTGYFGSRLTPQELVLDGLPISSGLERTALEGAVLPGNERGVRALAKEIKRLITEDKRRGLDV